ncbi:hypothetical protein EFR00_25300 [Rhizobium sophoriradicis]|nr:MULTISPECIES: hypothetical protein [Rhizobium]RSB91839.1 hypothetical protein EFR00_25300 [Rhizobium sophoriradicis]
MRKDAVPARWLPTTPPRLTVEGFHKLPVQLIKNFEMFTDCFVFLSELCHLGGDEIVFSETIAVEMPHA